MASIYNGSDTSGWLMQEYTYHPVEERVLIKKNYNSSGTLTETVYYVSKELVRIVNSSGTYDITYVYHEGQLVAERDNDGTKTFYHPDHLGSTTLLTDSSGSLVEETFYTPYGLILSGGSSRFDYEGKEFDSLINQYDFHFRGYKAEWGKFTQPDSLLPNVYDPQLLNRYAFERNNPWNRVDPSGHIAPLLLGGIVVIGAAAIGAGVSIITQLAVHKEVNWGKVGASAFVAGAAAGIAILAAPAAFTAGATYGLGATLGEESIVATVGAVALEGAYLIDEISDEEKDDELTGLEKIKKDEDLPENQQPITIDSQRNGDYQKSTGGGGGGGSGSNVDCITTCTMSCDIHNNCDTSCSTYCTLKN